MPRKEQIFIVSVCKADPNSALPIGFVFHKANPDDVAELLRCRVTDTFSETVIDHSNPSVDPEELQKSAIAELPQDVRGAWRKIYIAPMKKSCELNMLRNLKDLQSLLAVLEDKNLI